jgi:GTPase Era involved in 16S rRNA processing
MYFHHSKEQIRTHLLHLQHILAPYGYEDRTRASLERLDREKMNLLVVGEFSRGKSTFINAILGKPILPSKVNPTTATVNLIVPGQERTMTLIHHDGMRQTEPLPEEQINKFLEKYVTVSNEGANSIKQVILNLPGPMEAWNCVIVDTPGVNDLDDVREEVTYNYLRNADACIVLLDSQQPLSSSERRFIQDKVMANDVNRLFFVINRMDEVESIPNGPTSERLKAYVLNLLNENFPTIKDPLIYTVSSKETLRARFKKENNAWNDSFGLLEQQLYQFISDNASKGRLEEHIDRAIGISMEGIHSLSEKYDLLGGSSEELQAKLTRLREEEDHWKQQLQELDIVMSRESITLSQLIQQRTRELFAELRRQLERQVERCEDDNGLIQLKSDLSRGIRSSVEVLIAEIEQYKRGLAKRILQKFGPLFDQSHAELPAVSQHMPKRWSGTTEDIMVPFEKTQALGSDSSTIVSVVAAGGVLGYIGAALLGPIGIAAAVISSIFLGNKLEEDKRRKQQEQVRRELLNGIRKQLDKVVGQAETNALNMAKEEIKPVEAYFRTRVQTRVETIHHTLQEQRNGLMLETGEIERHKEQLSDRKHKLHTIMEQLFQWRNSL